MTVRRIATWLLGLVGVAVIGVATPDPRVDHQVSWSTAPLQTAAATDRIAVEVISVVTGSALGVNAVDTLTAEGVFVVVQFEAAALTEQVTWVVEARTRDGRWYAERPENAGRLGTTPAGFTSSGTAVFMVPAERVAGLQLAVTPTGRSPISHTAGVLIDLGLTGQEPRLPLVSGGEDAVAVTR